MKLKNILSACILGSALLLTGCSDFLSTSPTGELSDSQIITSVPGLRSQLMGTYRLMRDGANYGVNFYSPQGIMAVSTTTGIDIMVNDEQIGDLWYFTIFGSQRYDPTQNIPNNMWNAMYKIISNANVVIANIDNVTGEEAVKNEIKGQALAIRARCYFNLIRFYQHTYIIAKDKPGVPVYLDPTLIPKPRETVENVYKQILTDLKEAETLLGSYVRPSIEYYDQDVVNFLLANVYLTMNNWADAEKYANKVRTSYSLMTMEQYKAGFSTINDEWVLGYIQTSQDYWWYDSHACWYGFGQNGSPWEAELFIPVKHFVEEVMKDDPRNLTMVNPLFPKLYAATKFKELKKSGPYGDLFDFRAAEMYLVEAEAAARNNETGVALSLLNTLQNQRGATVTTTSNKEALIDAILLERRKEMWGEGLDYFDVVRLQKSVVKTKADGFYYDVEVAANSNKLIMRIPENEIINNPEMEQNTDPSSVPVFVP